MLQKNLGRKKRKKKKKQHSIDKELIPNTHSREIIKLQISLCYLWWSHWYVNTPTSQWLFQVSLNQIYEISTSFVWAWNIQSHDNSLQPRMPSYLIIGWTTCQLEDAKVTLRVSNYIFYTNRIIHNNCGIFLVALLTITSTNQGCLFFIFVV
jgi:hypothetical protein